MLSGVHASSWFLHVLSCFQLDQEDLETVVPKEGARCRVVNGRGRGCDAQVVRLRTGDFCVDVRVASGALAGSLLEGVEYEDICKVDGPSARA